MKLDDAYNAWGGQSENRELAQKTKKIFHNIWWLIPTNQPCNYYTLPVLARALQQANGAQSDKVKAASVMCHVLNYAHNVDPEGNNKPDFIFSDIVNFGEKDAVEEMTGDRSLAEQTRMTGDRSLAEQTREDALPRMTGDRSLAEQTREDALPGTRPLSSPANDEPQVKVKPAAKAKRIVELAKRDGGKAAEKAAKAVVQLDAETLKPIKVCPSCFAAQKELGIKNVQRAISRHGISGGFYWCRPGDEESFKPLEKRGKGKNKTKTKSTTHRLTPITEEPKPLTKEQKDLYRKVFNRETAADGPERQPTDEQGDARGQSPDREPVKVQSPGIERPQPETLQEAHENFQQAINEHVDSILRSCTDDELIAELRRREWHGTLRITRTIEL